MTGRLVVLLALCAVPPAAAQAPARPAPDSLRLGPLLDAAVAQDPRARQVALHAALTDLRLRDLLVQRRPQLALGAEATYQSEVPAFTLPLPGVEGPTAPRLRAQTTLDAELPLYDGGRLTAQAAAERARLAETQAGVAAALYPLRLAVAEAFFGARLAEERIALLDLQAHDLEARRDFVETQAREGAALAADVAAVEAELLRLEQQRDEALADRQTALSVLGDLVGLDLPDGAPLALPDLAAPAAAALATLGAEADTAGVPAERPEFAVYGLRRARLAAEAEAAVRQTRPRLSAFGQAGLGRPGLAMFDEDVHPYGLVGLRMRWPVLDWGTAARARETARLQQELIDAEEAAFRRGLRREVEDERAAIARLARALATDDAIVALREEVERVARRQFEEGVLLAPDYTRRLDELYAARTTRALHRAQLARARARFLLTLGLL